jgi:hypothetical protein
LGGFFPLALGLLSALLWGLFLARDCAPVFALLQPQVLAPLMALLLALFLAPDLVLF